MSPSVSVVIVSYNSSDDLALLLPHLVHPEVQVIVVDNASVDGSRDTAGRFNHVVVLPQETNRGWTAACNIGARRATGRALAFVNPDARPTADQLIMLASRLSTGVASVSPHFVEPDGTTSSFYFRFPQPVSGLLTFTSAGRRLDTVLGGTAMSARLYDGRPDVAGDVDQAGAACLVVDRASFLSGGGLPEAMWLFFSDASWCRERCQAGEKHLVAWDIRVIHVGGSSVTQLPVFAVQRLFQRDYFAYARRHYGPVGQVVTGVGLLVLGCVLPAAAAAFRREWAQVRMRLGLGEDLWHVLRGKPVGERS